MRLPATAERAPLLLRIEKVSTIVKTAGSKPADEKLGIHSLRRQLLARLGRSVLVGIRSAAGHIADVGR